MSQRQRFRRSQSSQSTSAIATDSAQSLQRLLDQKKYRQVLEEIPKIRKTNPEFEMSPPEAQIWLLRGQQELQKQDFKQADRSFRRSLELGLAGEAHYWVSRCLVAQNRIDEALKFIQPAFEQKQLPKEYAICYLKLLLLKGDTETVDRLITQQAKQFSAAQLHWVRGILALKEQPQSALESFRKIKRPLTPGDVPDVWIVYAQQQMKNWQATQQTLGLQRSITFGFSLMPSKELKSPILKRLALIQQAKTGEPPFTPADLQGVEPNLRQAVSILSLVQLIESEDYHNAAHVLLNSFQPNSLQSSRLLELNQMRSQLLTLAGQQALAGGEPQCTELFWKPLLANAPFNPQLAVNLVAVLTMNDSDQDLQRLLTQLIRWVEQDSKQHPENWPGNRATIALATLHCQLADAWLGLGRHRAAIGELERAERIDPTSAEVAARRGIIAYSEQNYAEAIQLLTQAIEGGSRFEQAYSALLECYDATRDSQAKLAARRKFGKYFGDLNPELEIEFPVWLEALFSQQYILFKRSIEFADETDPPLTACQIFIDAVSGEPNSGGRVLLNQAEAQESWDGLLAQTSPDQQVPTLQAIALSMHLFARREKGIAAIINRYTDRLAKLGTESADAKVAHLIVLAVRGTTGQKFDSALRSYLDTTPQPNTALAQLQLQVRRFGWIRTLIPAINQALEKETQNPLLLLAKATTYPFVRPEYDDFKQQGFELARRLQDAKALQAFREEEAFIEFKETESTMSFSSLNDFDDPDEVDMLEAMIRQIFGQKIPAAELDRMMPELKRRMLNEFSFPDDEEIPMFGNPKKRKRDFRSL